MLFTLNFKTALYHLTSNLFTLRTKKNYKLRVVFRSLQFLPCIYSFTVRKPLTSNDVNNSFDKIISNYRYSIFSGAVCCPKYSHYHAHKRKFLLKSSNVEQWNRKCISFPICYNNLTTLSIPSILPSSIRSLSREHLKKASF